MVDFQLIIEDGSIVVSKHKASVGSGLPDDLFSNQKILMDWKMFIYFMAIWNTLWRFGIFYDNLVHFVFIWYIFPGLVSYAKKNLAALCGIRIVCNDATRTVPDVRLSSESLLHFFEKVCLCWEQGDQMTL
jgi:hypothetical protein